MPIPEGLESNLPGGSSSSLVEEQAKPREVTLLIPADCPPVVPVVRLNRREVRSLAELPYVMDGLDWIWSQIERWANKRPK